MTDDLVKRLRLIGEKRLQCTACYKFIETADEAADRIEKLEAALREIVEQIKRYDLPAEVVTLVVLLKAEKALEGEDD